MTTSDNHANGSRSCNDAACGPRNPRKGGSPLRLWPLDSSLAAVEEQTPAIQCSLTIPVTVCCRQRLISSQYRDGWRRLVTSLSSSNKTTAQDDITKHRPRTEAENNALSPVAYPGFFSGGGGSTNSVEDRGQRGRGSGGGSPLVRGSGGSCNLVQEI